LLTLRIPAGDEKGAPRPGITAATPGETGIPPAREGASAIGFPPSATDRR